MLFLIFMADDLFHIMFLCGNFYDLFLLVLIKYFMICAILPLLFRFRSSRSPSLDEDEQPPPPKNMKLRARDRDRVVQVHNCTDFGKGRQVRTRHLNLIAHLVLVLVLVKVVNLICVTCTLKYRMGGLFQ